MSSSSTDIMYIKEKSTNIFEDNELINLIKQVFNETDNKLFELSFKLYNMNYNNSNKYIIDLVEKILQNDY
jgi:hypothetical protein